MPQFHVIQCILDKKKKLLKYICIFPGRT